MEIKSVLKSYFTSTYQYDDENCGHSFLSWKADRGRLISLIDIPAQISYGIYELGRTVVLSIAEIVSSVGLIVAHPFAKPAIFLYRKILIKKKVDKIDEKIKVIQLKFIFKTNLIKLGMSSVILAFHPIVIIVKRIIAISLDIFGLLIPEVSRRMRRQNGERSFEIFFERFNGWVEKIKKKKDTEDPFSILELKPGASLEEIKDQYHKLAKQYHPDKNPSAELEEKFKRITTAYQLLIRKKDENPTSSLFPRSFKDFFTWDSQLEVFKSKQTKLEDVD